jgi:TolB-like protein/Flp pilus assembly protein TadD
MERRLAAILAVDVAGYSRLIGADEEGTLAALKAHRRELIDPKIAEHRGRIVKTTGDGALVEFASALDAVRCAVDVQQAMAERNAAVPGERRIELRIGINVGDVIFDENDIFGDGVNIAARLEGIAQPGGVCISARVHEDAAGRLDLEFEDMGDQRLKNIAKPVRAYRVWSGGENTARPALGIPDKPSIAVLPFQNMSGDAEQEFICEGMAEDIITALSKLRWFFVIARNSTFTYKGKSVDVRQVSRELGVRYVLEGSVRKAGTRLRITSQLIDAMTGNHIWAERYDRELADIFAVQDEIAQSVVSAIEPQLYAAENLRIQSTPPESLDAWRCVIRALWHIGRLNREDNELARGLLDRAIALSPRYAKAHSLRTFAELRAFATGVAVLESAISVGQQHAQLALTLDDQDAWAFFAMGAVEFWRGRYGEAIAAYMRAIDLNPNFALAHGLLGESLAWDCEPDAALAAVDRAIRMSPHDPFNAMHLLSAGIAHFAAKRYIEGIECQRKALQERPRLLSALRMLAACCAELGKSDEARAAISEMVRLEPDISLRKLSVRRGYSNEADQERFVMALRSAGIPE